MSSGLILPPFRFTHCTDNNTGTPQQTVSGTNFTAAANNADGTSVAVITPAHDVHYLVIGAGGIGASAGNAQALLDILSDPAGGTSWGSFIDDLPVGFSAAVSNENTVQCWYHFPVWIKSGTALGVRCRTAHTADITTGQVVMYAYGNPTRPDMWWCGQKVEAVGVTAASSTGTSVTAGSTGTFGSWTAIGSTAGRWGALQFGACGTDATAASVGYHWQVGVGSQKVDGTPNFHTVVTTGERMSRDWSSPIFCDIPASTGVQVRGTATAGTVESFFVTLHGVY